MIFYSLVYISFEKKSESMELLSSRMATAFVGVEDSRFKQKTKNKGKGLGAEFASEGEVGLEELVSGNVELHKQPHG